MVPSTRQISWFMVPDYWVLPMWRETRASQYTAATMDYAPAVPWNDTVEGPSLIRTPNPVHPSAQHPGLVAAPADAPPFQVPTLLGGLMAMTDAAPQSATHPWSKFHQGPGRLEVPEDYYEQKEFAARRVLVEWKEITRVLSSGEAEKLEEKFYIRTWDLYFGYRAVSYGVKSRTAGAKIISSMTPPAFERTSFCTPNRRW